MKYFEKINEQSETILSTIRCNKSYPAHASTDYILRTRDGTQNRERDQDIVCELSLRQRRQLQLRDIRPKRQSGARLHNITTKKTINVVSGDTEARNQANSATENKKPEKKRNKRNALVIGGDAPGTYQPLADTLARALRWRWRRWR